MGDLEDGEIEEMDDVEFLDSSRGRPPGRRPSPPARVWVDSIPKGRSSGRSPPLTAMQAAERYASKRRDRSKDMAPRTALPIGEEYRRRHRSPPSHAGRRSPPSNGQRYQNWRSRGVEARKYKGFEFSSSRYSRPSQFSSKDSEKISSRLPVDNENFDSMLKEYKKIQDRIELIDKYQQDQNDIEIDNYLSSGPPTPERSIPETETLPDSSERHPSIEVVAKDSVVFDDAPASPDAENGDDGRTPSTIFAGPAIIPGADEEEEDETVEELQLRMMALQSAARRNPALLTDDLNVENAEEEEGEVKENDVEDEVIEVKDDDDDDDDVIIEEVRFKDHGDIDWRKTRRGNLKFFEGGRRDHFPAHIRHGLSTLRRESLSNRDNYERISMEIGSSDDEREVRSRRRGEMKMGEAPQMPQMPEMLLPLRTNTFFPPFFDRPPLPSKPLSPPPPPPRETPPNLMDISLPRPRVVTPPPLVAVATFSHLPPRQAPPPPSFSSSLPGVAEIPLPAPSPPKMPTSSRSKSFAAPIATSPPGPRIAPSPPHLVELEEDLRNLKEDESEMSDISEEDPWELLEKTEEKSRSRSEIRLNEENRIESERAWEAIGRLVDKNQTNSTTSLGQPSRRRSTSKGEDDDEDPDAIRAVLLAAMAERKRDSADDSPQPVPVPEQDVEGQSLLVNLDSTTRLDDKPNKEDNKPAASRQTNVVKKKRVVKKAKKTGNLSKNKNDTSSETVLKEVSLEGGKSQTNSLLSVVAPVKSSSQSKISDVSAVKPTQINSRLVKKPRFPQISPVIISIGNDSSDENEEVEGKSNVPLDAKKSDNTISTNIDSFLKEARQAADADQKANKSLIDKEKSVVDLLNAEKVKEYLKLKLELSRRTAVVNKLVEPCAINEGENASQSETTLSPKFSADAQVNPTETTKTLISNAQKEKVKTVRNMYYSNNQNIKQLTKDIFQVKSSMNRKIKELTKNEEKIKKIKDQLKQMEKYSIKTNEEIMTLKERLVSDQERLTKQKSLEDSIIKKLKVLDVDVEPENNHKRKAEGEQGSPVKKLKSVHEIQRMDKNEVQKERNRLQELEREMAVRIAQHQKELSIRRSLEQYSFMNKAEGANDQKRENFIQRSKRSLSELSSSGIKPHFNEGFLVENQKIIRPRENPISIELPPETKMIQIRKLQSEKEKKNPSVLKDLVMLRGDFGYESLEKIKENNILNSIKYDMIFPLSEKQYSDVPPFILGSDTSQKIRSNEEAEVDDDASQRNALGNTKRCTNYTHKLYKSPLSSLKSYRLLPKFRLKNGLKISSVSFSYKCNSADNIFCPFDLSGTCNDKNCFKIHHGDLTMTTSQIVMDLAAYSPEELVSTTKDQKKLTESEASILLESFSKDFIRKNAFKDVSTEDLAILTSSKVIESLPKKVGKSSDVLLLQREPPWKPFKPNTGNAIENVDENQEIVWKRWKMTKKEKDYDEAINLQNPMGGDNCYGDDFFFTEMTDDIETTVMENPDQINLWLKLASIKLRTGKNLKDGFESALNVLARGLELNNDSKDLWFRYLSVFDKYQKSKESWDPIEMVGLLKQAILAIPDFKFYHWRFTIENCFEGKLQTLKEGIEYLCTRTTAEEPKTLSHKLFTLLMNLIALMNSCQFVARIAKIFDVVLNEKSFSGNINAEPDMINLLSQVSKNLTVNDRATLHLISIHTYVLKGQLPNCIFDISQGTFGAVVDKNAMFLIPYKNASISNIKYWNNIGNRLFLAIKKIDLEYQQDIAVKGEATENYYYSHPGVPLLYNYFYWATILPRSNTAGPMILVSIDSISDKESGKVKKHLTTIIDRLQNFMQSSLTMKQNIQVWKILYDLRTKLVGLNPEMKPNLYRKELELVTSIWPRDPYPIFVLASSSKSKFIIEKYLMTHFNLEDSNLKLLETDSLTRESLIQVLFEKALGIITREEVSEDVEGVRRLLPPPSESFSTFILEKPQRRTYLWLCYIEWLQLAFPATKEQSRIGDAFEQSLSLFPTTFDNTFEDLLMLGRNPRQILWLHYLSYVSRCLTESPATTTSSNGGVDVIRFIKVFKRCLSTSPIARQGDGLVMVTSPEKAIEWEDLSFHNQVIDLFLRHCDDRVWPLLLFRLIQAYPANAYLILRLASFFFSKSYDENVASLKPDTVGLLIEDCLKKTPNLICLWKLLISCTLKDGHISTARSLFSKCLELNPTYSSMWKEWFLFELGHLEPDDEKALKDVSLLVARCLSSCGLDLQIYLKDVCGKTKKPSSEKTAVTSA